MPRVWDDAYRKLGTWFIAGALALSAPGCHTPHVIVYRPDGTVFYKGRYAGLIRPEFFTPTGITARKPHIMVDDKYVGVREIYVPEGGRVTFKRCPDVIDGTYPASDFADYLPVTKLKTLLMEELIKKQLEENEGK